MLWRQFLWTILTATRRMCPGQGRRSSGARKSWQDHKQRALRLTRWRRGETHRSRRAWRKGRQNTSRRELGSLGQGRAWAPMMATAPPWLRRTLRRRWPRGRSRRNYGNRGPPRPIRTTIARCTGASRAAATQGPLLSWPRAASAEGGAEKRRVGRISHVCARTTRGCVAGSSSGRGSTDGSSPPRPCNILWLGSTTARFLSA
mmetsp:Transcript_71689/g.198898  ORF Transcript_71689/g.198898 Transcript_71689/m.198898 type:complete len:203 (+) Transcript_71689:140-748(+)